MTIHKIKLKKTWFKDMCTDPFSGSFIGASSGSGLGFVISAVIYGLRKYKGEVSVRMRRCAIVSRTELVIGMGGVPEDRILETATKILKCIGNNFSIGKLELADFVFAFLLNQVIGGSCYSKYKNLRSRVNDREEFGKWCESDNIPAAATDFSFAPDDPCTEADFVQKQHIFALVTGIMNLAIGIPLLAHLHGTCPPEPGVAEPTGTIVNTECVPGQVFFNEMLVLASTMLLDGTITGVLNTVFVCDPTCEYIE